MTKLLRGAEVAEMLSISKTHVFRLAAEGTLPAIQINQKTVRFSPDDVAAFIERQRRAS